MAKNFYGRIRESKIEAQELQSLLEQVNIAASQTSFDPEKTIQNASKDLEELVSLSKQFYEYQKSIALGGQKNAKLNSDELKSLSRKVSLQKKYFSNREKEYKSALKNAQSLLTAKMLEASVDEKGMEILEKKQEALNILKSKQDLINKSFQKASKNVDNLEKKLKRAAIQAKGFERSEKALEGMNKLMEALPFTSWLNPFTALSNIINFIVSEVKAIDKAVGESAKSLNRSYQETFKMKIEMAEVAKSTPTIYDNSRDMLEVFTAINEELGTSLNFTEGMTKSQKEGVAFLGMMYKYSGLTLDEVKGLQRLSYFQGQDVKKMSADMMAQYKTAGQRYKVALNEKKVLKDIQKTSAFFKINIEGGAIGLADALAASQALAVSLDQVKNTAGGLLNFEQSIEKELSAELLLGKKINGEYMRTLAFNKDYKALAEEIRKTAGSSREEFERNAIQSQALADFLGMSVESMAQMVYESESAQAASEGTVDIEQRKLDALNSQTELAQQQLELQEQQASVAETFDAQLQNLVDTQLPGIFSALEMIREVILNAGNYVKKILSTFNLIKEAIALAAGFIAGKLVFQLGIAIAKFVTQVRMARSLSASIREQNSLLQQQVGILTEIELVKSGIATASTTDATSTNAAGVAAKRQTATLTTNAAAAGAKATADVTSASALSVGAAAPFIIAGIGAIMAAASVYSMVKSSMDDGVIGPGYGSRVLLTPQGGIAFNNKDTIVAGTNLTKGNDVISSPEGSISLGGGSDPRLLEEIMKMNRNIENLASRPIDITTNIDGEPLINMKGNFPNEDALVSAKDSFKIS